MNAFYRLEDGVIVSPVFMTSEPRCLACERRVPKLGRRLCPECRQAFRVGWEGVDAHWRARHQAVMPYETFWTSLCRRHRSGDALGCPCCLKGIPADGPRQCPECALVFRGKGWEGLEAHWRSQHIDVLAYEDLLATLCPAHKLDADRSSGFLRLE